ncbi:MAG: DUF5723 family protein [Lentimicrobium sp.]|uniref:DUF5723 family protein n=1 Tax=Lentimicrobium sp. TaxID=2034841 RepID=UPI0025CD9F8F|nr:DUF5723 family protein [Lentimicrobium sp.]MCO5255443.1 DUF5723 family protein [Lentimicrobium sp.]HPF63216.1 DUF5723 family protein [Lentimicrobium sp.]HPJ61066.1 DUF5723 family protein [Lentimicrobium sp.]HRW68468.1 DUF5723 family protein [Lentimicrobium sp.]
MKRIFKCITFIVVLMAIMPFKQLTGQSYLPFAQSNYSGAAGLLLQPASIADSRYRFDMTVFGTEMMANNTFVSLKKEAFFKPSLWEEEDFGDNYVFRNYDGKDKYGFLTSGVILPSFMINLNDRSAIGFSTRARVMLNIDNITEDLAQLFSERFDYEPLLRKTLSNANFSMQANSWAEFGVTYATVILNKEKHFLKGGATLKFLQGFSSGYVFINDLTYRLDSPDTLSLFQSSVNYGISETFDEDGNPAFESLPGPGFGFDLGLVYEYRPDIASFTYSMDGEENLLRNDKDKYLFRLGISLLDFGSIRYKKGFYSQDFNADIRDWYIHGMEINSISDINDTLRARFGFNENTNESYSMGLPTALSLQADYNLGAGFYLNFTPFFALRKGTSMISKTHYVTSYTFTPRYDHKWFGFAVPVHLDQFNRFNAGLSLRLGPVWIGSNTIINNRLAKQSYALDGYIMFKLPVYRSVKGDRDKDGVSDENDLCPDVPGTWEMRGCPDADADGIPDHLDDCPYDAGTEALRGCPDRDGDGIADKDDQCPDHPGLPQYNGCPDSDGDGIVDHLDECPDQPGLASLNGCPDRDGDGIPDRSDLCPDTPGKPEFGGCPFADSDKDGIPDEDDDCPTIPGPKEFMGCPDTDGDGISDKYDLCPTIAGVPENNGCPAIKKEEKEIIDRAFSNLEFESGKSVIKTVSYPALNELAELLVQKPVWKVLLSGHTDNTGKPESNMTLSKNRTQAVKDYLISKGVEEFRIRTEWFGQERPVADNKTPAGRQKNRRVEMKIVFD